MKSYDADVVKVKRAKKSIVRLGQLPPNILTPRELASVFNSSRHAVENKKEMVGLHAVGGTKSYLGETILGSGVERVALIGKGVTFDSGGISIKPGSGMKDMKFDMLGAATAHAVGMTYDVRDGACLHILAPCAENTFHDDTYRPGDILHYPNGVRVEVDNTDAEGRLILADAIIEAKKHSPKLIITIATLTGACVGAVGESTGVFSNCDDMVDIFLRHAEYEEELAWRLPLWKCHRDMLDVKWDKKKKDTAVFISNSVKGPGASTAAAFLQVFIGSTPWIHLDIAGSAYKDGVPTGAMLKTLTRFLNSTELPITGECKKRGT